MYGRIENIAIQGICSAVPSTIESNDVYAGIIGDRRAKKQIKLTGVKQRHISSQAQKASDLCYAAAEKMLDHLKWSKDEIKIMILITQDPNYASPSTSFLLHKRLGLSRECVTFDMNLGCSSFNVGLQTIASMLQVCENGSKALLLLGDTEGCAKYPGKKYTDGEIAYDMLFGSEGTCVAVEKCEGGGFAFLNRSDGNGYQAITKRVIERSGSTHMDGSAVFEFAVNDVSSAVNEFKAQFGLKEDDIDYYVFHQAQQLILDSIIDSCNISPQKELRSLEEYGNTSGGSVPLTVNVNCDAIRKYERCRILFCGFGVGLSWGCIYTDVPSENILPVIECDDHFEPERHCISDPLNDLRIGLKCEDGKLKEWIKATCEQLGASAVPFDKIEEDADIDGYILAGHFDKEDISGIGDKIRSKDESKEIPVVLVRSLADYDSRNAAQENIQKLINEAEGFGTLMRVNAVLYDPQTVNADTPPYDGCRWSVEFVKRGCPEDMSKAAYLAHSAAFLLSDHGRYIKGSIMIQK